MAIIINRFRLLWYYVFAILQCDHRSLSHRILGIFPVMSTSHFAMHNSLMKGLASTGRHEVTVLSFLSEPLTPSDKLSSSSNYTQIYLGDPAGLPTFIDSITPEEAKKLSGFLGTFKWLVMRSPIEEDLCVMVYSNEYVKRIMRREIEPPELLITEQYHLPCYNSLAEMLDIPAVASIAPVDVHGVDYLIGNPIQPSYWPFMMNGYTQTMDFYQRLVNWLQCVLIYAGHYLSYVKLMTQIDERFVRNEDSSVDKLYRRTSFVFFNSHFSFLNRPIVPNAVEIGGIHIKKAESLPSDILKFIDDAEDGVILFSFGSSMKMSSFPKEKIDIFKNAFSQIPQRVLWRSDTVNLTDVSANVMIRKWFPQRDVLEHQNVKAFISHGGIFGTYEAIHTATPVVGIPFMYDQFTNVNILQEKGVAIYLDYDSLDYETIHNALKNIINDHRYRDNMQLLSAAFKDRPMSPLETAIYWVEYAIRHKGAPHLRVAAADMPFYKFLLLDVIGLISTFTLLIIWIIYYYLFKKVLYNRSTSVLNLKKNQ